MSDRTLVIDMETRPGIPSSRRDADRVELFMDGESGTWRLFVAARGNSDFSLKTLTEFRDRLNGVLADVERDPEAFNAEVRAAAAWVDADE